MDRDRRGGARREGRDPAAWLTCFTFWAPVSDLVVAGRRAWARPGVLHRLLVTSAGVFALAGIGIVGQSPGLPRIPLPKAELPVWIGIAIFYGAVASWIVTPFLSVLVFALGRRRQAR